LLGIVKQFIRNVRAAKTIADERAVIQKESAAIRASFREESHDPNIRWVQQFYWRDGDTDA
jgi:AP-1 complex subunit gamma-1